MKIGNLSLKNNVISAPMAGISDKVFRRLVKTAGAGLVCSEMISATALKYNPSPRFILSAYEDEAPISMQLFGGVPEDFDYAVKLIESQGAQIIDLNAGCPVPKVIKQKAGSYLLKEPLLLGKIISVMRNATKLPLTVKIRLGWDANSINVNQIAKIVENEGADAITIHARTRSQGYTGQADWDWIRQVKAHLKIPVIGNGDIIDGASAKAILDQSGCDGIMIGRAAIGNPWLFREITYYLGNTKIVPPPTLLEKIDLAYNHSKMLADFKGESTALKEMRKFLVKYFKGIPNVSHYKSRLSLVSTLADLKSLLNEIKNQPMLE